MLHINKGDISAEDPLTGSKQLLGLTELSHRDILYIEQTYMSLDSEAKV